MPRDSEELIEIPGQDSFLDVITNIVGILILLVPRLLNYIVAIYLIVIGIIGLGIFK